MNKPKINYYPLIFKPVYKESLWGGNLIKTLKGDQDRLPGEHIGESWELVDRDGCQSLVEYGELAGATLRDLVKLDPQGIVGGGHGSEEPFPLLLKIIDAQKDLSLQVHPDKTSCKSLNGADPKTEMWYILDHDKGAEIYKGIKESISEEEFLSKAGKPGIKKLINSFKTETGDSFTIYGNTIHAIGRGNLIYEVQQNSDTTYRINDWGRKGVDGNPRELHLEEAGTCLKNKKKRSLSNSFHFSYLTQRYESNEFKIQQRSLSLSQYFLVEEFKLEGKVDIVKRDDSFQTIYAVDNDLNIILDNISFTLAKGQTCLLPAKLERFNIEADHKSTFLRVKVA